MIEIDYIDSFGCFSVLKTGGEANHREALVPGQWERAKEILPEHLIKEVAAIWTPEVVAAWEETAAPEEIAAATPTPSPPSPLEVLRADVDTLMIANLQLEGIL